MNVFPKKTGRTIDSDGIPDKLQCKAWTNLGDDNGLPATLMNNVDYDNTFVGQYSAGDLQYKNHNSINNNEMIYWKETKVNCIILIFLVW